VIDISTHRDIPRSRLDPPVDDRPHLLDAISDALKMEAIDEALAAVGLRGYSSDLQSIDYRVLGHRGSFVSPVRLGLILRCFDSSEVEPGRDISEVSDVELCEAVRKSLSARAGENYLVELGSKHYSGSRPREQSTKVRLSILVARSVPA